MGNNGNSQFRMILSLTLLMKWSRLNIAIVCEPLWHEWALGYNTLCKQFAAAAAMVFIKEFEPHFIFRNPEITVKSTDFWQKAFSLHVFINPSNQHGTTQQSHSSVHKSGANQHQQGGGMQGSRGEGVAVPVFLQPVLKEILLAGKCMELLESMGKLPVILNKYHPGM